MRSKGKSNQPKDPEYIYQDSKLLITSIFFQTGLCRNQVCGLCCFAQAARTPVQSSSAKHTTGTKYPPCSLLYCNILQVGYLTGTESILSSYIYCAKSPSKGLRVEFNATHSSAGLLFCAVIYSRTLIVPICISHRAQWFLSSPCCCW